MESYKCPICDTRVDIKNTCDGVCLVCAEKGYWIDPAGSIHTPSSNLEDEDLAYEDEDFYIDDGEE